MSFTNKKYPGFTIVELLIVVVVIAILAAISVVAYAGIQERARDSKRASDIAQIKKALLLYDTVHGGVVRPGVSGYTKPVGEPYVGGWDVSTGASWLVFLRSSHGEMPVDPVNVVPDATNPNVGGNKLYAYYCYDAGLGVSFPDSAAVALWYLTDASGWRTEKVRVSSCLRTIPT